MQSCGDTIGREKFLRQPKACSEAAKAVLLQTAGELGLTEKETRSYLGMVLEAQGRE